MRNIILCAVPGDELFIFGSLLFSNPTVVLCYKYEEQEVVNFINSVNYMGADAVLLDVPNAQSGAEEYLQYAIANFIDSFDGEYTIYTYNNLFDTGMRTNLANVVLKHNPYLVYKEGITDMVHKFMLDEHQYVKLLKTAVSHYPWKYADTPIPSSQHFIKQKCVRSKLREEDIYSKILALNGVYNTYVVEKAVTLIYFTQTFIYKDYPKDTVLICHWDIPEQFSRFIESCGYKKFTPDNVDLSTRSIGGLSSGVPMFDIEFPIALFIRS